MAVTIVREYAHANAFVYMQDEEVVQLAKGGHRAATEFLFTRYRALVENKAKAYFVIGADRDDVIQEGMIGLYKAIRDFKSDRLAKFRPFAELCVTRQIITAVKTATRQKHVPLNGYISLNRISAGEMSEGPMLELVPDQTRSIDDSRLEGHLSHDIDEKVKQTLSGLEQFVLQYYLQGLSYREMSAQLSCHTKCVDNALQRVKRKMGHLLKEP